MLRILIYFLLFVFLSPVVKGQDNLNLPEIESLLGWNVTLIGNYLEHKGFRFSEEMDYMVADSIEVTFIMFEFIGKAQQGAMAMPQAASEGGNTPLNTSRTDNMESSDIPKGDPKVPDGNEMAENQKNSEAYNNPHIAGSVDIPDEEEVEPGSIMFIVIYSKGNPQSALQLYYLFNDESIYFDYLNQFTENGWNELPDQETQSSESKMYVKDNKMIVLRIDEKDQEFKYELLLQSQQ